MTDRDDRRGQGRRSQTTPPDQQRGIQLDRVLVRGFDGEDDLRLSLTEFRLLSYLEFVDRPATKAELMLSVFGLGFIPETNTLAVTISRLRDKLPDPGIIETLEDHTYRVRPGAVVPMRRKK